MVQSAVSAVVRTTLQRFADPKLLYQASIPLNTTIMTIHQKICSQANSSLKDWKTTILLNKQKTTFKIDTGAQCNVISKRQYNQICNKPLLPSHARLVAFGGTPLHPRGKAIMPCQYKNKQYSIEFEIIDQNIPSILGLRACTEMNLIPRIPQ